MYLLTYSSFNTKRHAIVNTEDKDKLLIWLESKGYLWKENDLFYNKENDSYMEIELVKAIKI